MFKFSLHSLVLQILIRIWPNLFKRYYSEYKKAAKQLRRRQRK